MSLIQALGNVSKVRGALIFVEDLEAASVFYRDVIGVRLLYRTSSFVRFDATQGTSLALIAGGVASPEPKDYRRGGVVPEIIVDNLRPGHRASRGSRRPPRGGGLDRVGSVLLLLGPRGEPAPVLRIGVHPPGCRSGPDPGLVRRGGEPRRTRRPRSRIVLVAALGWLALVLAGCGGSTPGGTAARGPSGHRQGSDPRARPRRRTAEPLRDDGRLGTGLHRAERLGSGLHRSDGHGPDRPGTARAPPRPGRWDPRGRGAGPRRDDGPGPGGQRGPDGPGLRGRSVDR